MPSDAMAGADGGANVKITEERKDGNVVQYAVEELPPDDSANAKLDKLDVPI